MFGNSTNRSVRARRSLNVLPKKRRRRRMRCESLEERRLFAVLLVEDFEDNTVNYTVSTGEFFDSSNDHFTIVPLNGAADPVTPYVGFQGSNFFSAEDMNNGGRVDTQTLTFSVNVEDYSNITLSGLFAVGGNAAVPPAYDDEESLLVRARFDGGAFENILAFEAEEPGGDTTNNLIRMDTDFDGVGDGTIPDHNFMLLTSAPLAGSGTTLEVEVIVTSTDGGSEFAFDNFMVEGDFAGPSTTVTNTNDSGAGSLREAIINSNATAGTQTIDFDIPGAGPHIISIVSALPIISDSVVIDGTTEPDYAGAPVVGLDGSAAGAGVDGLKVQTSGAVISGLSVYGFSGDGIEVLGGGGNTVSDSFVGLDLSGSASGNFIGVKIVNSAGNTLANNTISGNNNSGVFIVGASSSGNTLTSNRIGTNSTGTSAVANAVDGVNLNAPANFIGLPGQGNLISGNTRWGISAKTAGRGGNIIQSNVIGLNAAGTAAIPNLVGIRITNENNQVGGTGANDHNVISGNTAYGLEFATATATGNTAYGNLIGTDELGMVDLGNGLFGVRLSAAPGNTIGGTGTDQGNLISGNDASGILAAFVSADNNQIMGNRIGTNLAGTAAIGNGVDGVRLVQGASGNLVSENQISGNGFRGVSTDDAMGSRDNEIRMNLIGTNETGTMALHNGSGGGVRVLAPGTIVDNNVISAPDVGIFVLGNAVDVSLTNNAIGVTAAGATTDLGMTNGIQFAGDAVPRNSTISGNEIANNSRGIRINSGTGVRIENNSFHNNSVVGIDLGNDNATPNDPFDNDVGPNNLQNHPELSGVTLDVDQLTLTYRVDSTAQASQYPMTIEFYVSDGNGQGQTLIGTDVYTQPERRTNKTIVLTVTGVTIGDELVATATDFNGNTSEFGDAASVFDPNALASVAFQNPISPTDVNDDSQTTVLDALLVINLLGTHEFAPEAEQGLAARATFADVNGDGFVTAADALWIINSFGDNMAVVDSPLNSAESTNSTQSDWQLTVDDLMREESLF